MTLLRQYLSSFLKKINMANPVSDRELKSGYNIELPVSNYHTDKAYLKVYVDAHLLKNKSDKHQIDHNKCVGCKRCIKECQVNAIS